MISLRTALVSALALTLSAFALGGCAATSEEADDSEVPSVDAVAAGPQTIAVSSPLVGASIVFPECRAILLSTGPIASNGANSWGCPAADPYTAQRRLSGEVEGGLIELRDEAQFGKLSCSVPKGFVQPVCTKTPDRLLEKTCTELRVYECPCGVENVTVEGGVAAACKRAPR
jgi:hypothetical protein